MCGISGFLAENLEEKETQQALDKMNGVQSRRGPDDAGVFVSPPVALGHRRLSILDLSNAGHQPMTWTSDVSNIDGNHRTSDAPKLVITYNGEIYNFRELRRELKEKGYKFKTETDTEVILAGYNEWGIDVLHRLRGMFAFGLWDGKAQKLYLVKDRYGIKPLYYYKDNKKLVFASTVKALTQSGLVPTDMEDKAWIGFLLFGSVPVPWTTIKNVFALPAGHYLEVSPDLEIRKIKYYDPLKFFNMGTSDVPNIDGNHRTSDVQKIAQKTRELLQESVKTHLISDAPLGVFLSGGLDSSAIAALAANMGTSDVPNIGINNRTSDVQKLITLSIDFEESEYSERKYQDMVVERIKSDHRRVLVTKKDFEKSLEDAFSAIDQPTIDGINTYFIAKAAKEVGLKTVLSGLGADEIFLGYPYFKKAKPVKYLHKIPNVALGLNLVLNTCLILGQLLSKRFSADKWRKFEFLKIKNPLGFYLALRGLYTPSQVAKILDTETKEVNSFIDSLATFYNLHSTELSSLDPVDLMSYLELKFYLQNQLLKDTDFMAMHHSVEVRVPFLDHKLVEYISGLPPEAKLKPKFKNLKLKIKNSRLKPFLAAAAADVLPLEVLSRAKMGFTFPFQKWLEDSSERFASHLARNHWSRNWARVVLKRFIS